MLPLPDIFEKLGCSPQQHYANAASVWLDNLAQVSSNDILELFECIPSEWISQTAIEFALYILALNQSRLLTLRDNQP